MSVTRTFAVLEDLPDPRGRLVLVRATLDLPFGLETTEPTARRRAQRLADTLRWLTDRGARVTVCGDAAGADPTEEARRFECVREEIAHLAPGAEVADSGTGGGASAEDRATVMSLVAGHDLFVNDSPRWSHLPLPSLLLPPRSLPSAAGRSLQNDLDAVAPLLDDPPRPFVAVLGGVRSAARLHGLTGLVLRADTVLVGGAMAVPLLAAVGHHGYTRDDEALPEYRAAYGLAARVRHDVQLPTDLVWRDGGTAGVAPAGRARRGEVVDVGPATAQRFADYLQGAGSVLWAGSLGRVEDPRFAAGTVTAAEGLARSRAVVRVLGGDALLAALPDDAKHGADVLIATDSALELVKLGDLPAVAALRRR